MATVKDRDSIVTTIFLWRFDGKAASAKRFRGCQHGVSGSLAKVVPLSGSACDSLAGAGFSFLKTGSGPRESPVQGTLSLRL
jgi:hypothetical protein